MTANNNLIKNDIHNLFIIYSELSDEIKIKKEDLEKTQNRQKWIIVKVENLIGDFDKNE